MVKKRKRYSVGKEKHNYNIFQLWRLLSGVIVREVDNLAFDTWFRDAVPLSMVGGNLLVVRVDNRVVKETIDRYYMRVLKRAAKSIGYNTLKFAIVAVEN